jgi:hypothetical protein
VAWQSLLESQEAGMGKSRVRVVQVGEEHGMGEYEEDLVGSKVVGKLMVLLQ